MKIIKMENSIEKDFLHYQESLELKEIGFDEPCVMYFWDKNYKNSYNLEPNEIPHWSPLNIQNHNQLKTRVSRPTFSQAFRWFRDNYKINPQIAFCEYGIERGNSWKFTFDNPTKPQFWQGKFESYEEAELACLRELIKIVKDGK